MTLLNLVCDLSLCATVTLHNTNYSHVVLVTCGHCGWYSLVSLKVYLANLLVLDTLLTLVAEITLWSLIRQYGGLIPSLPNTESASVLCDSDVLSHWMTDLRPCRWCAALLGWHQPDNCQLIQQHWSHPPSASHKPVTPLRHRTGVTYSFCAVLYALPSLRTFVFSMWVKLNKQAARRWSRSRNFLRFRSISQSYRV